MSLLRGVAHQAADAFVRRERRGQSKPATPSRHRDCRTAARASGPPLSPGGRPRHPWRDSHGGSSIGGTATPGRGQPAMAGTQQQEQMLEEERLGFDELCDLGERLIATSGFQQSTLSPAGRAFTAQQATEWLVQAGHAESDEAGAGLVRQLQAGNVLVPQPGGSTLTHAYELPMPEKGQPLNTQLRWQGPARSAEEVLPPLPPYSCQKATLCVCLCASELIGTVLHTCMHAAHTGTHQNESNPNPPTHPAGVNIAAPAAAVAVRAVRGRRGEACGLPRHGRGSCVQALPAVRRRAAAGAWSKGRACPPPAWAYDPTFQSQEQRVGVCVCVWWW